MASLDYLRQMAQSWAIAELVADGTHPGAAAMRVYLASQRAWPEWEGRHPGALVDYASRIRPGDVNRKWRPDNTAAMQPVLAELKAHLPW